MRVTWPTTALWGVLGTASHHKGARRSNPASPARAMSNGSGTFFVVLRVPSATNAISTVGRSTYCTGSRRPGYSWRRPA